MNELRTRPVVNSANEQAVLQALSDFTDTQHDLFGFVILDSSRKANTTEQGEDYSEQGRLFEPTTKQDLISQGNDSGATFLTIDRNTGELDIVPPIYDTAEHNRLLNLASSVATLAVNA